MAIFKPGQRFRYHRILGKRGGKREVAALLSLTAMVDMFTVLVVFLLQNYNVTGEVLFIPKEVILPSAESTKDLKPAIVLTLSNKEVFLDKDVVMPYPELQAIEYGEPNPKLFDAIQKALEESKLENDKNLQKKLQTTVNQVRGEETEDPNAWRKITLLADKDIDILSVKKILFVATEAGAGEISYSVNKKAEQTAE